MTQVVINGGGRYVRHWTTGTVPEAGQQIVDLEQDDIDLLLAGGTVKSMQDTINRNRAFRDDQQILDVLGLGSGQDLTGNLLRNWAQDITRQVISLSRQMNNIHRAYGRDVDPRIVEASDPDSGPE